MVTSRSFHYHYGRSRCGTDEAAHEWLLIEEARRDRRKFAALYELHFDRIYAYAFVRTRDREAAEDLTAEVFLRALRGFDRYEHRGSPFAAWLYRIAAHLVADRGMATRRERPLDPSDEPAEAPIDAASIEEAERRSRLANAVRALPVAQREVIELRFGEDRSIRTVAEAIGKSEGAVKQLQLRALRTLRERMGNDEL